MSMPVAPGRVATIHFVLHDGDGNRLEASAVGAPMSFLVGAGNMVPGVEEALDGHGPGDHVDVTVPPEKGYGQASGTDPVRVKKSELPRGRTWNQGEGVRLPGPDGTTTVLWVSKAKGAWVWLSRDHPLAGKTLVFSIDIVNVRQATQAEVDHGHAHGHDGHEHH